MNVGPGWAGFDVPDRVLLSLRILPMSRRHTAVFLHSQQHGHEPCERHQHAAHARGGHKVVEALGVGGFPHAHKHHGPDSERGDAQDVGDGAGDAEHRQGHQEQHGAQAQQPGLIDAHARVAEHVGDGALALGCVGPGIAHVVDVHDGHNGTAQCQRTRELGPAELVQVQEATRHHGHDAEEQKAHEVAQSDISVRVFAHGVEDRRRDGGQAKDNEDRNGQP